MPDTMTVTADPGARVDTYDGSSSITLPRERPEPLQLHLPPLEDAGPALQGSRSFPSGQPAWGRGLRALRLAFWGAALLVGAFDAWYPRFSMSFVGPFPDAVAYLDIAAACARGAWSHLLNAYWSPLYPGLLAVALRWLHPGAAAEFTVVHLVNFLIFAAALASFEFLWRGWLEDHQARAAAAGRSGSLPPWALLAIGYSLFLWSSICWISVQGMGPDLLVAALIYLAAGLTLRLRRGQRSEAERQGQPGRAALLGIVLGLGFLAKAVMLPLAFVFLLVALLPQGRSVLAQNRGRVETPGFLCRETRKGESAKGTGGEAGTRQWASDRPFPFRFALSLFRASLQKNIRDFARSRFPERSLRRAGLSLLAASIAFLMVTAPFVYGLSRQEGRLTFGDTGRLNYAWWVNGVQQFNWQGKPSGHGTPLHPTRVIYPSPPVYEFAGPIGGTYPIWTDPSYWTEGIQVHFNGRQQADRLVHNLTAGRRQLPLKGPALLAALALLPLFTLVLAAKRRLPPLVRWDLVLLALAPAILYALVVVESRYLGPSVVLLGLALIPAIRLPNRGKNRAMVVLATALILLIPAHGLARVGARDIARRRASRADWDTATALDALGIHPGDRVGLIGLSGDVGWARLARVSVVAEIPSDKATRYWRASPGVRAGALGAFAKAGVRAVVAGQRPTNGAASGWRRLGGTDRYVHLLKPATALALTPLRRRFGNELPSTADWSRGEPAADNSSEEPAD